MRAAALTLLLAALPSGVRAAEGEAACEEWEARLTRLEGEVYVYPDGGEDGLPAEKDQPLSPGDRVATGKKSRAEIALDAASLLELGPESTFVVEALCKNDSIFEAVLGSILGKIKSLLSEGGRLRVRTPTAVASVRGTEFGLDIAQDGETVVGVFEEGELAVSAVTDEEVAETVVAAGRQTRVGFGERLAVEEREGRRELRLESIDRGQRRQFQERFALLRGRPEALRGLRRLGPEGRREARARMSERMRGQPAERARAIRELHQGRQRGILRQRGALNELRERIRERRGGPGERGGPGRGPGNQGGPGERGGPGRGPGNQGGPGERGGPGRGPGNQGGPGNRGGPGRGPGDRMGPGRGPGGQGPGQRQGPGGAPGERRGPGGGGRRDGRGGGRRPGP